MIFHDLTDNITVIIVLALSYDLVLRKWSSKQRDGRIAIGVIFGLIAVAGMLSPVRVSEGIIFDGRSIIISLGGLLGGWIAGAISALLAIIYRLFLGGDGALTGAGVIVSSAAIGALYNHFKGGAIYLRKRDYFLLGLLVHICLLLLMFTLPDRQWQKVLPLISVPILTIYPLATLFLGMLLAKLDKVRERDRVIEDERIALENILKGASFPMTIARERNGEILFCNGAFQRNYYGSEASAVGQPITAIYKDPSDHKTVAAAAGFNKDSAPLEIKTVNHLKTTIYTLISVSRMEYKGEPALIIFLMDIHNRKLAELALAESEMQLRSVFEQSVVGITHFNREGYFVNVSDKTSKMLGHSEDELSKLTFMELTHQNDRQKTRDWFIGILEKREPVFSIENRFVCRDEAVIWTRLTIADADAKADRPNQYLVFIEDITSIKRTERVLPIDQEYFADIFEKTSFGVAQLNSSTGEFQKINNRFCDLLGYTVDEMKEFRFQDITHPEDLGLDLENIDRLRNNQIRVYSREKRYFRKDGSIVWVKLTIFPIWRPGELTTTHIAIVEDITPRKELERELQKSRERLSLAVSGADLGMWDWDVHSGQVIYSEKWASMLGYDITELEMDVSTWTMLLHPEDFSRALDLLNRHLEDDSVLFELEVRMKCKNDEWKWVLSKGRVVKRDASGEPLRMTGTHLDINDRKEFELKLEENAVRLEQKVLERTQELQTIVNAMSGREVRMAELKGEIETLREQLSQVENPSISTLKK